MAVNNYNTQICIPLTASGDMNSYQYYFVTTASADSRFQVSTGASNPAPLGVLQDDPQSLQPGNVCVFGVTRVVADADTAIGYGDFITSGSNGMAVINTNGSSVAGIALETLTSGTGVTITAFISPFLSDNKTDNVP